MTPETPEQQHPAAVPMSIDDMSPVGFEPSKKDPNDGRGAHLRRPDAKFNPQAYQANLDSTLALLGLPDGLYNPKLPNLHVEHEKPEHRIAFYLKAQGKSYTEISKVTGYTIPWLSQLCRQPWAQARIVEQIKEAGGDAVKRVLEGEVLNSLTTLVEIRDDEEVKGSTRVAAANSLLDRHLGKAIARVEATHITGPATSLSEIDRELATVRDNLKRLAKGIEEPFE